MEAGARVTGAAMLAQQAHAPEKFWVAVQMRYRFEKKVAEQLSGKGMEVFLPACFEVRKG